MEALVGGSEHPPTVSPSIRELRFVCPACRGRLSATPDAYRCRECEKLYRVHAGIPDFRVFRDPYLDFEEDRDRTEIVLEALDRLELRSLLEHYWSFSDVTPPLLRQAFVDNALRGELRGERILDKVIRDEGERRTTSGRLLEIGSGTGNLLALTNGRFEQVVGTDIAMRWLHLSRRRFMDKGLPAPALVCCCAEALPFEDDSFDVAIMASTLEFLREPKEALSEAARVLSAAGTFHVNTVNRHSLSTNPYALLWGVGFLPRRLQARYVRWRREASFENIRLVSLGELRRLSADVFEVAEVGLADVHDDALAELPARTRALIRVYRVLKSMPGVGWVLKRVAPEWDVRFSRPIKAGVVRRIWLVA